MSKAADEKPNDRLSSTCCLIEQWQEKHRKAIAEDSCTSPLHGWLYLHMFADVFSWEFLINELQNGSSRRNIQSCAPRAVLCQIDCQEFVEAKRTGSLYKMLPSLRKLPMEHLVVVLSSIKNRILQCRFSVLSKQKNGPKTILAPRSMKTFQPTPQTTHPKRLKMESENQSVETSNHQPNTSRHHFLEFNSIILRCQNLTNSTLRFVKD